MTCLQKSFFQFTFLNLHCTFFTAEKPNKSKEMLKTTYSGSKPLEQSHALKGKLHLSSFSLYWFGVNIEVFIFFTFRWAYSIFHLPCHSTITSAESEMLWKTEAKNEALVPPTLPSCLKFCKDIKDFWPHQYVVLPSMISDCNFWILHFMFYLLKVNRNFCTGYSIDYEGETAIFDKECENFMKSFVRDVFSPR